MVSMTRTKVDVDDDLVATVMRCYRLPDLAESHTPFDIN
jgi:Arc/MetJ family transcription regulator